ncbi:DHS-like NAD/FAD-binding domain-containing protein, partial [Limtongia smithiae]|uniref:DHS-like NAD/FAD-binding domain-containing protein n=1 Tax=Limtongia smithiae TaxID=1125753 RepID=UPI0034CFAC7A
HFGPTLHDALTRAKRVVVVVGAGISVNAGIPDFRTATTGLFSTLKTDYKLKGATGQSLFDSSVYADAGTTGMFHSMVSDLHARSVAAKEVSTPFHRMLSRLAVEKKLLRLYTQNVDCIEVGLEGLQTEVPLPLRAPWPRTIQLHGGLQTMVCAKCGWLGPFDPSIFSGQDPASDTDGASSPAPSSTPPRGTSPECGECLEFDAVRKVVGKRTQGIGRLRPRIVLYNEFNPDADAIGAVSASDLKSRPDALFVVGTSLKIPGVKRIVREMAHAVHLAGGTVVWVNDVDEPPAGKMFEGCFDLLLMGDCQLIPGIVEREE